MVCITCCLSIIRSKTDIKRDAYNHSNWNFHATVVTAKYRPPCCAVTIQLPYKDKHVFPEVKINANALIPLI